MELLGRYKTNHLELVLQHCHPWIVTLDLVKLAGDWWWNEEEDPDDSDGQWQKKRPLGRGEEIVAGQFDAAKLNFFVKSRGWITSNLQWQWWATSDDKRWQAMRRKNLSWWEEEKKRREEEDQKKRRKKRRKGEEEKEEREKSKKEKKRRKRKIQRPRLVFFFELQRRKQERKKREVGERRKRKERKEKKSRQERKTDQWGNGKTTLSEVLKRDLGLSIESFCEVVCVAGQFYPAKPKNFIFISRGCITSNLNLNQKKIYLNLNLCLGIPIFRIEKKFAG